MKNVWKYLVSVLGLLGATVALAGVDGAFDGYSPFRETVVREINTLKAQNSTSSYSGDGLLSSRVARVTYDVSADGGGIGAHALGVTLPAHSMIKQAYFYLKSQFVSASSGTLALSCEDANNIYSASSAVLTPTPGGAPLSGVSTGTAANMVVGIGSACEVTATIASASFTGGKLNLFLDYIVTD